MERAGFAPTSSNSPQGANGHQPGGMALRQASGCYVGCFCCSASVSGLPLLQLLDWAAILVPRERHRLSCTDALLVTSSAWMAHGITSIPNVR